MLAGTLITNAYYLSGLVARDEDNVQGSEGNDGLFWLNNLFDELSITTRHVPYIQHIQVALTPGQELYFVPNLARLDVASFNIGTVRYQMYRDNENHYWGAPRVDNIQALPFNYYSERYLDGTNVYLYFTPQSNTYVLNITGRFLLPNVLFTTDLDLTFDQFYQVYLMYELAGKLCGWNKISMAPSVQKDLDMYRNKLRDLNPLDVTITKIATLSKQDSISYAQANLGKGWTQA